MTNSTKNSRDREVGPFSIREVVLIGAGSLAIMLGLFLAVEACIIFFHPSVAPGLPSGAPLGGGLLLMVAGADWIRRDMAAG